MKSADPILRLTDVSYRWPGASGFALSVTQFNLAPAEAVLLLGQSGSGKSTLLSLICGTLTADQGQIEIAGTDISGLRAGQRDRFRAEHIGLIFQQFNLLPYATVIDNITLPLRFAPLRRARVPDPQAEAGRICADLGLPADVLQTRAANLSVGQQQRVAAARALIGAPPLIIADEPTSALDAATQTAFLDLLFAQCRAHGSTLMMVSHDARLATQFDRSVTMSDIANAQVPA